MDLSIVLSDISHCRSDALIYSTNKQLLLTGGVGKSLYGIYGEDFNKEVSKLISGRENHCAEVGEVFSTSFNFTPWKKIFHTVATNEEYSTKEETIRAILSNCLEECDSDFNINTVSLSLLGCGYGDLTHEKFMDIINDFKELYRESELKLIICTDDQEFYSTYS